MCGVAKPNPVLFVWRCESNIEKIPPTHTNYQILSSLVSALRLTPRLDALAAEHCPPNRRRYHCALYDALAAALVLRALCGLEGRSAAPLSQLVRDSVSAPAADDLMQGELGL